MSNVINTAVGTVINYGAQYGAGSYQAVVTVRVKGATLRARKLVRTEMTRETGKIEVYIVDPTNPDPTSAFAEDWMGYAHDMPAGETRRAVENAIGVLEAFVTMGHVTERANLLELDFHANAMACAA